MITFAFVALSMVLFGGGLYLAYIYIRYDVEVQFKALQKRIYFKERDSKQKIVLLRKELDDTMTIVRQLQMSAPNKIDIPSGNALIANTEKRFIEKMQQAKVV